MPTEKLASRVGASLLKSAGLDDLIVSSMSEYEATMVKCVSAREWFAKLRQRLEESRHRSPLFDTERWVRNLEAGLMGVIQVENEGKDVVIVDDDYS